MRISILIQSIFTASLGTVFSIAVADPASDASTAAVVVHGATPSVLIAPAWQMGRTYKFGNLVNYDNFAFKAKSGSAHIRPDVSSEIGWEKLNACDDKSKGAVQCEQGNQTDTPDTRDEAQREYQKVKEEMNKGKPTNSPEG